jgi:hypothetical protein
MIGKGGRTLSIINFSTRLRGVASLMFRPLYFKERAAGGLCTRSWVAPEAGTMRTISPSAGIEHHSSSPEHLLTQIPGPITYALIDRKAMSLDINRKDLTGHCLSIKPREEQVVDEKERGYFNQSTVVLFPNKKI